MTSAVYKLFRQSEWRDAMETGIFTGSADDRRDGFIHLSAANQVRGTLEKYFAGDSAPVLVAFDSERLGSSLKWETSRGGQLFPHFYGVLEMSGAIATIHIRRENGVPVLPAEIP